MKKFLIIFSFSLIAFGCDSYLDMKPIDPMTTTEDVFAKRATTEKYLYNVYSYVPKYYFAGINGTAGEPWVPCSDEADAVWNNDFQSINNGAYNSAAPRQDKWQKYYQAIREANYFMLNVDKCTVIPQDERTQFYWEARCLRAYYYFLLMRQYGPVVIIGDDYFDAQSTFAKERNSWDECVDYVCDELTECAKYLPEDYDYQWKGKVTSGMALAYKARLLLYSASPLFNSDNSLYKDYKNKEGENLFPTSYDKEKWKKAADAAMDVIQTGRYSLNVITNTDGTINPYKSLLSLAFNSWDENPEMIFGRITNDYSWYRRCIPCGITNGWGGMGVTQAQVDAYAMADGKYPIDGYIDGDQTRPIILEGTGYSEEGSSTFTHPFDNLTYETYNMYVGREPRFYMDVNWDRMYYVYATSKYLEISFQKDGNSGPRSQNYSTTGYTVRKFNSPETDAANGRYKNPLIWPNMRLAEIYLDYTEALIEYDPTDPDIFTYWNKVRHRAGVPDIDSVYTDIKGNQELLRKYIRAERRVELSYEAQRYFDVRRWMIAPETNNGYSYGMYVNGEADTPIGNSEFWTRHTSLNQKRVFKNKDYFFPIHQDCLDRDELLQQSPFWN